MEEHLLTRGTETENKWRWKKKFNDAVFEFYIPKWRIPSPTPQQIKVSLFTSPTMPKVNFILTPEMTKTDPELCHLPIIVRVEHDTSHTRTELYRPINESNESEIGHPYIPHALLNGKDVKEILICVKWC